MILELMEGLKSLSVIGICKNAGKTTVLNRFISELEPCETLALTSVGRDGESVDVVTGTKKPAVFVREGTLVATAAQMLPRCDISREILGSTGITTPVGEVVLVRARSAGYVDIAGPSMTKQLFGIMDAFFALGATRIAIDGAISRKSLSCPLLTEASILCAGASLGPDIDKLVDETRHIAELFSLKKQSYFDASPLPQAAIRAKTRQGDTVELDERALSDSLEKIAAIASPGALTDARLKPLTVSSRKLSGLTLVAADATKLLFSPDTYAALKRREINIEVSSPINLIAVAVNPFSAYGAGMDGAELKKRMQEAIPLPVINVLEGI